MISEHANGDVAIGLVPNEMMNRVPTSVAKALRQVQT
jgi:hypothetical protein